MKAYTELVKRVLEHGVRKPNRTGIDAISSFAESYRVDLQEGFPLLTTKKMQFRSVMLELPVARNICFRGSYWRGFSYFFIYIYTGEH
ncbi:MAG: thymidylate synthase, partial [Cyclonatronaceae bacterium]